MVKDRILTFEEFSNPSEQLFLEIWNTKPALLGVSKIFSNFHFHFLVPSIGEGYSSYSSRQMDYLRKKAPDLERGLVDVVTIAYSEGKKYGLAIDKNIEEFYGAYVVMRDVVDKNIDLFRSPD